MQLNKQPTCLVGGDIRNVGDNVILGSSDFMVAEIDESDQTQELSRPDVAVITNIEADHLDQYGDFGAVEASFVRFVDGLDRRWVVGSKHDRVFERIVSHVRPPNRYTFGFSREADFYAENIQMNGLGSQFDAWFRGEKIGIAKLKIPGGHNIANALAAIASM
jgi:UDP-N-acetylmuramate--alanine ligase